MRPGWPLRRLTWQRRALPDVIIPGAQKAGTSSLFAWMVQHPDVHGSVPKEVHFFDGGRTPGHDTWGKGQRWYRAHFPTRSTVGRGVALEASPLYLFHPHAAERIAGMLPEVRLVVLLRNPVDRAISHYFHEKTRGREPLGLLDALRAEDERLGVRADGSFPLEGDHWIHASYVQRGLYAVQLKRLRSVIAPDRILVLESTRLFEHPHDTLRTVFDFCGVDADFQPPDLQPRMVGHRPRVEADAIHFLEETFEAPNRELFSLLGEEYDW